MAKRYSKTTIADDDFKINQDTLDKSPLVSTEAKVEKVNVKNKEATKMAGAKPSVFLSVDENDYHESSNDAPTEGDIIKKTDNAGNIIASSYSEKSQVEQKNLQQELNTNNQAAEVYAPDGFIEIQFDDSPETNPQDIPISDLNVRQSNLGSYVVKGDTPAGEYGTRDVAPVYIPQTAGKVTIYQHGKIIGEEEYVTFQNQRIVKKYYVPFKAMYDAAKSQGVTLILNNSYRDYNNQLQIRYKNLLPEFEHKRNDLNWMTTTASRNFKPLTGRPGWGIHNFGAAFDITTNGGNAQSYNWLCKNAIHYGFIRTVPSETWHWEYKPWVYDTRIKVVGDPFAIVDKKHNSWMNLANDMVSTTTFLV